MFNVRRWERTIGRDLRRQEPIGRSLKTRETPLPFQSLPKRIKDQPDDGAWDKMLGDPAHHERQSKDHCVIHGEYQKPCRFFKALFDKNSISVLFCHGPHHLIYVSALPAPLGGGKDN